MHTLGFAFKHGFYTLIKNTLYILIGIHVWVIVVILIPHRSIGQTVITLASQNGWTSEKGKFWQAQ